MFVETQHREDIFDNGLFLVLGALRSQLQVRRNSHILQHRQQRLQLVLLRDVARHPPKAVQIPDAPVHINGSLHTGPPVPGQAIQQCGFSGTRWAHDGNELASRELSIYFVQDFFLAFSESHTDTVGHILELDVYRFAGRQILERPNMVRLDVIVRLEVSSVVVVVVIAVPGIIQHMIQVARIFSIQRNSRRVINRCMLFGAER